MKLLYCFLAICAVASANPVKPTREELKNLAKLILSNIEYAPEEIDGFIYNAKVIVNDKLQSITTVSQVKKTLNDKLAKIEPGSQSFLECIVSIEKQYDELKSTFTNDLMAKLMKEKYGFGGHYLSSLKQEFLDLRNQLKFYADEEVNACLDGKSQCKLNTDYLVKGQEYFTLKSGIKDTIQSALKSADDYFHTSDANKTLESFAKKSNECLLA